MNREELNNKLNILTNQNNQLRVRQGNITAAQNKLGTTNEGQRLLNRIITEMTSNNDQIRIIQTQLDKLEN